MDPQFLHCDQAVYTRRAQCHEVPETYALPAEQVKEPLVCDIESAKPQSLHATSALRDYYVHVGRGQWFDQGRQTLRQVFPIGIHYNDAADIGKFVRHPTQANRDRALVSDVASQSDYHACHGCFGERGELDRFTYRSVIDRNDKYFVAERVAQFPKEAG
jgi:hypothetical protein